MVLGSLVSDTLGFSTISIFGLCYQNSFSDFWFFVVIPIAACIRSRSQSTYENDVIKCSMTDAFLGVGPGRFTPSEQVTSPGLVSESSIAASAIADIRVFDLISNPNPLHRFL